MPLDVRLRPITPEEYDAFFVMCDVYERELDLFDHDQAGDRAQSSEHIDVYRAAILEDLADVDSGRELFWVDVDGAQGGFCITRTLPDWPDHDLNVAEIVEFYVDPAYRRRGAGRAAVEALLATHRGRGTRLVEAAILRDNAPAHAFWHALGFEVRSVVTARRP
ncbi:MAG: N-acetyltransferase [Dehalococcoidia bacterium]|nr:N-acetyltransferase [Dehalococcoidia bacterium]